jgi:hypothetical protein
MTAPGTATEARGSALGSRLRGLLAPGARMPLVVACAAVAAGVLGWSIHSGRLTRMAGFDRQEALRATETAADFLRMVRAERERRPALDARLERASAATLGGRLDAVDGALRARLNRIAEETGLRDLVVATAAATERRNPGRSAMNRMGLPRAMRDEADFVEVRATLAGEGAVDQVLRLVHRIAVDPMLKRIETVKFDPTRDGSRVRVTMKLATIFLPGRAPAELPGAPSAEALAGFAAYAPLAQRNPFRVPAPSAPTAVAAAPAAPAPPASGPPAAEAAPAEPIAGFPYGQWILTGMIEGPAGTEAWFRNAATREARVLRPQDGIAEFVFVGLAPEGARLAAGGANYVVRVGDSLEERSLATAAAGRPGERP